MASMKRGVGYCENTDCEDYAKGVFLLNHGDTFYCPRCRQLGKVEKERGFYTGNTDIFKEVRVEYNFDPINGVYREIAIVRDESLCSHLSSRRRSAHSRWPKPFSRT
jgi:ribosomal protein S27AE